MADSGQQTAYSCKCLNVRIQASPPPSQSPEEHAPDGFTGVFVGEEGVDVAHVQLTLRNRGPPTPRSSENNTETVRVVSLTCLMCQTLVYRVTQVISPDVDGGEGPIMPTDEWAESEVLKSAKGWIQVSKDCLSGNAVQDAETSPTYSSTFRIILPSNELPSSENEHYYVTPPPASPEIPSTPRNILPHIPALFPPPPFTSTHPVFVHLSSLANVQSDKLRTDAENELRRIVEEKVAEVKAAEAKLKHDVELLWATFRISVDQVGMNANGTLGRNQSKHRRSASRNGRDAVVNGISASVRVKDFVPAPAPPPRLIAHVHGPAVSALSASLATSSLHAAMAPADPDRSRRSQSPAHSHGRSTAARADSPSTASSKTLGVASNGEAEIREAFRRNMDQSLDVATSFKYMMNIGAHVASREPEVPEALPEEDDSPNEVPSSSANLVPRGRSPRAGKSAIKKPKSGEEPANATQSPQRAEEEQNTQKEITTPKGKRKVTFDVKPEVAIIATDVPTPSGEKSPRSEEAVFDMENENAQDPIEAPVSTSTPPSEPEPAAVPDQAEPSRRISRRHMAGLPSSFSTLRPASLPLPSAVRPLPHAVQVDERSRPQSIREAVLSPPDEYETKRREIDTVEIQEEERVTDPREAEILRLVAASTPSHRSAWKKDSSAWRTFVARQKAQKHERSSSIPEEDESSATDGPAYYDESGDSSDEKDFWNNDSSIAKSLPIPIGPLGTTKKGFGSYQPKTGSLAKVSSTALRRASYAERDRHRSLDPGALDFTEEDEVDDEDEDVGQQQDGEGVAKSMQRALKILQKGSETPGAGMWRSLA